MRPVSRSSPLAVPQFSHYPRSVSELLAIPGCSTRAAVRSIRDPSTRRRNSPCNSSVSGPVRARGSRDVSISSDRGSLGMSSTNFSAAAQQNAALGGWRVCRLFFSVSSSYPKRLLDNGLVASEHACFEVLNIHQKFPAQSVSRNRPQTDWE